jgi:hypothetical protein
MGRNSSPSLHIKTSIIQTNPKTRLDVQRFQNKVLRKMVNAPWYIRNNDLHRDLQVDVVSSEMQRVAQKHEGKLQPT